MAPPPPPVPRDTPTSDAVTRHSAEPPSATVTSVVISVISIATVSVFLTQKVLTAKSWQRLPLALWLVLAIYLDSFLFVFAAQVLRDGIGIDSSPTACEAAILLCLIFYVSTKILIYLFLVEKAHIIRVGKHKRMRSKLYIFNAFGLIGVYFAIVVLNFVFRISRVQNGQCIIGMQNISMIPLISFDVFVNAYLTILFLIPLQRVYSNKTVQRNPVNIRLRTIATRTFIGVLCTLASSVTNLTVLMVLKGEPGWVCLLCCNSDILFSVAVIQWVTFHDNTGSPEVSLNHINSRLADAREEQRFSLNSASSQNNIRKQLHRATSIQPTESGPLTNRDPVHLLLDQTGPLQLPEEARKKRWATC